MSALKTELDAMRDKVISKNRISIIANIPVLSGKQTGPRRERER